jgi:hypothetical protein
VGPQPHDPRVAFTIAAGTRDGARVAAVNVNSDNRDYPIETFSDLLDDVYA